MKRAAYYVGVMFLMMLGRRLVAAETNASYDRRMNAVLADMFSKMEAAGYGAQVALIRPLIAEAGVRGLVKVRQNKRLGRGGVEFLLSSHGGEPSKDNAMSVVELTRFFGRNSQTFKLAVKLGGDRQAVLLMNRHRLEVQTSEPKRIGFDRTESALSMSRHRVFLRTRAPRTRARRP